MEPMDRHLDSLAAAAWSESQRHVSPERFGTDPSRDACFLEGRAVGGLELRSRAGTAGCRNAPASALRGRRSMTSRFPSQFMRHGSAACSLRRSPEAVGLLRDCIMTAPPFPSRSRAKARESGTGPRSCGRAETGTRDNGWRTVGDGGCRDGIPAVNGGLSSDAPSKRRSAPQDQTAGFVEISRSRIRCGNRGEEACSGGGCDRSRQASKP
jgi:hypothetical protein